MKVLFLSSTMGPAEATWIERLTRDGHHVDVLSLTYMSWLQRASHTRFPNPPQWLHASVLQDSGNQIAEYFRSVTEQAEHELVIASGLAAAGVAARQVTLPFIPLLWRQDLDFSRQRTADARKFSDLTVGARVLFLEDDLEFDKALSKNSRSVHLLHPPRSFVGQRPLLTDDSSMPRVVLMHPESWEASRVCDYVRMFEEALPKSVHEIRSISIDSLYRAKHMQKGREFATSAMHTLKGATHIAMLGSSRHGSTLASYLVDTGHANRIVIEDTLGMSRWGRQKGFSRLARGVGLAKLVQEMLEDHTPLPAAPSKPADAAGALADMVRLVETDFAAEHEELDVLDASGSFNVFFSTSGIEDRTDGARPQRIRNMSEAIEAELPTVRLNSHSHSFERRRRLVESLLASGRTPSLFYGENSTSPMPDATTRASLAALIERWGQSGGVSAWFVRDLHWLEEAWQPESADVLRDSVIENGLDELNVLGPQADVLLAPNEQAVEGYRRLLSGHAVPSTPWSSLPPGVASANIVDVTPGEQRRPGPTVVYAGGIGSVYAMDTYLRTIEHLVRRGFFFDFVIRESEGERLRAELEALGIANHPNISVTTAPLDLYMPKSKTTIGAVLLDGEYAKFAFPYKTMSMIERGFPIITYSDMAIAKFVEDTGTGVAAERSPDALVEALLAMTETDFAEGIEKARQSQRWTSRVATVRHLLGALRQSMR